MSTARSAAAAVRSAVVPGFSRCALSRNTIVHFRQTGLTFRREHSALGQYIGRQLRNLLRRLHPLLSHNQRIRHFAQNRQERLNDRAGIASAAGMGSLSEPAIRSRT